MKPTVFAAASAVLLAIALAAPAQGLAAASPAGPNHRFPDGSLGFALDTAGGLVNPEVLVDFNPQPDPPGFGGSRYLPDGGGALITTPASQTRYAFVMSFLGGGRGALPLPMAPNADGVTDESFQIGANTFDVTLAFTGPGALRDWAAFNPQPDPPGRWFGATLNYPTVQDPSVDVHISENGAPLSLSLAAPEPAAWALMLIGVGGVGGVIRAQWRRQPQSAQANKLM